MENKQLNAKHTITHMCKTKHEDIIIAFCVMSLLYSQMFKYSSHLYLKSTLPNLTTLKRHFIR